MNPEQRNQKRFYTTIASCYSSIFPFNPAQLTFLESETASLDGRRYLDAGCGTGELAFALATMGAEILAVDLNEALLEQARAQRKHGNIRYIQADMLDINQLSNPSSFDGVICFGNTLVHLEDSRKIRDFFFSVKKVLKPGGKFYLQILNYDYIFRDRVEVLPLIENESVRFERYYRFYPGTRKIRFITRLTIENSGETIDNETELFGIGTEELANLLEEAGFRETAFYSDFRKNPFGGNHLPLVVVCRNTA